MNRILLFWLSCILLNSCKVERYEINETDIKAIAYIESKFVKGFYRFQSASRIEGDADDFGEITFLDNNFGQINLKIESCSFWERFSTSLRYNEIEQTDQMLILLSKKFSFALFKIGDQYELNKLKITFPSLTRAEIHLSGCYYYRENEIGFGYLDKIRLEGKKLNSEIFFKRFRR
ncbi:hypothetical protein [Leptospira ryugenii]|nr:hypothetical protein [Leptospira ryugenii]